MKIPESLLEITANNYPVSVYIDNYFVNVAAWVDLHSDRGFENITRTNPYFRIMPYYADEDAYLVHKVDGTFVIFKPTIGAVSELNGYHLHGLLPSAIAKDLAGKKQPTQLYREWWKNLQLTDSVTDHPKLLWLFL
jgi:hypothetical protein